MLKKNSFCVGENPRMRKINFVIYCSVAAVLVLTSCKFAKVCVWGKMPDLLGVLRPRC